MKFFLPLILALDLDAHELTCPYAEQLMHDELKIYTSNCKSHNPIGTGYLSILASDSLDDNVNNHIFQANDQDTLNRYIREKTGNHFTGTTIGLDKGKTAYISFYHLDISPRFPFGTKCTALVFGNFSARGSVGTGLCDHTDTMIRFISSENKFIYFKSGKNPINLSDLFDFSQRYQSDICQITMPHILINSIKNFTPPISKCNLTGTPFGIVRQEYAIEFDPCLKDDRSPDPIYPAKYTISFQAPFSFCLTDILHTKIFASGTITGPDQLVEYTQSRFNYGCNPSHPGDSYE